MAANRADANSPVIYNSPWNNAYWFARMLLNTDQYGAIGKKDAFLLDLVTKIEVILGTAISPEEKVDVCKATIYKAIRGAFRSGTKGAAAAESLVIALDEMMQSEQDIIVFVFTARYVVLPTNDALRRVPSDDLSFCRDVAKNMLDTLGKEKVGKVVLAWDTLGVRGCLDVERAEIISEFTKLRRNLEAFSVPRTEVEDNAILTAFSQEFESEELDLYIL